MPRTTLRTATTLLRLRPEELARLTESANSPTALMSRTRPLEQVLSDLREDLQALRRRGVAQVPIEQLERVADDVAQGAEEYLRWLSEDEALLRSGRSRRWLRRQFPQWLRADHPRREGPRRYYRMLVIPQRAHTLAAPDAGRRAALEGRMI